MHGLEVTFTEVARHRPFELLAPTAPAVPVGADETPAPQPAPYVSLVADLLGTDARLTLASGATRFTAAYDAESRRVWLEVGDGPSSTLHRSRRFGRCPEPPARLALTLTGLHLTAFVHDGERWLARSRVDLRDRLETRTDGFVAALTASADGVAGAVVGPFGQLGLRDLRFVTTADGDPVCDDGAWLLTATHAGPGFFDAAHTGVWSLAPQTLEWQHRADLFFRRPGEVEGGVYGDHATHLVRDGSRWLVATSTWGDLDVTTPQRRRRATVSVVLAESTADLTQGPHVLDAHPLPLPTDGFASVATWDPHLVRDATPDGPRWLVGFVSSPKLFRFHPALAAGPSLDDLTLLAADPDRRATEGTTLVRTDMGWRVVASDGRDGRRGQRRAYPVFDVDLRQLGALDAAYLTNLPWPALARDPARPGTWWLVAFNGRRAGGEVLGYGTHGDVVVMRGGS
ncbi:hypothetical protein [Nocardioides bigeumensis]|uniref:Uncharacterized protein n=1 Tax=Nocardioides bigeumensis TaxID=433657 RepID=A0ABP5K3L2_9ACTN